MADGEEYCEDLGGLVEFDQRNRDAGLALFVFGTVYYVATVAWWYARREKFALRKRSFSLMALSAFGQWLGLCFICLVAWVGRNNFPCDVYIWLVFMIIPFAAGPIAVRLTLFHNKAKFNQALVQEAELGLQASWLNNLSAFQSLKLMARYKIRQISDSLCAQRGSGAVDDEDDKSARSSGTSLSIAMADLEEQKVETAKSAKKPLSVKKGDGIRLRFFATREFGWIVLFMFFIFALIPVLLKYAASKQTNRFLGHGCTGCVLRSEETIGLAISMVFISLLGLYMLVKVWSSPDPLGILRELYAICLTAMLMTGGGIALAVVDPKDLRSQGQAEWLYLVCAGCLIIHFIQCPLQVIKTYKRKKVNVLAKDETLEHVLGTLAGMEYFSQYLATEFSLENFYFYEAAVKFQSEYETTPVASIREQSRVIKELYLADGSVMEVNISALTRAKTLEALKRANIPEKDCFEQAAQEVFGLMQSDSFDRFLKSTQFKEYSRDKASA